MLARGASDCKCHAACIRALSKPSCGTRASCRSISKVVIEGEEESSSIHLDAWLEQNKGRLKADSPSFPDTASSRGNLPG